MPTTLFIFSKSYWTTKWRGFHRLSGRLMYGPVCPYQPKSPKPQDTIWKLYMTVLQTGTKKNILPAQILSKTILHLCALVFMSCRMCTRSWMISWVIMIRQNALQVGTFCPRPPILRHNLSILSNTMMNGLLMYWHIWQILW